MKANFLFEAPLDITCDEKTGVVSLLSPKPLAGDGQMDFVIHLTPEAAQQLLLALQQFEKEMEKPPSAHARQQNVQ